MKPDKGWSNINLLVDTAWPRLDAYLVSQLEGLSRTRIQSLIKSGQVQVDDARVLKPRTALAGGERIQVDVPAQPELSHLEPQALALDIIYEDGAIIVLNKPSGLVVHPGAGVRDGTLVNALLWHFQSLSAGSHVQRPGIVHRLDKGTSGVMVIARNDRAHLKLARQFEHRLVEKSYLALVWGDTPEADTIETMLARDARNRIAFTAKTERGRAALTNYKTIERFGGFSLLEVRPATGRTHQIRVHLSHINHPIFEDDLYGGRKTAAAISPQLRQVVAQLRNQIKRPALHAQRLSFSHPDTGSEVSFEAPLPSDMEGALALLRKQPSA
ncbi:MAG: RluA family pseudouridine synthase [Candidatus Marinimicrobia bacterium]|nr:RluA family pseudouridine synthase [Candidatus Neomarinimicrobiota bacterium]